MKPNKMSKKSEIQIFLAHANEDKEAVSKLYDRLKQAGYKPWLDEKDLIAGQNWRSVIEQEIPKSQLFIACLSNLSIAKEGYVQKEFKLALKKYEEMPLGRIYIIPLRLNWCEIPNLPVGEANLRDIHWLNYWEESGFDQLERALERQFGPFEVELQSERGVDYTRLRDLLAAKRWREADRETRSVMLEVAGLGQEDKLDIQSIRNFPCTDLRTIDTLWVKYSNEYFGFSVQKRIWSLSDVNHNFHNFIERVGWARIEPGKVIFNHINMLTFNLAAPEGQFPMEVTYYHPDKQNTRQEMMGKIFECEL